ncbi:MAG: DUF3341 domain-containing protein [Planctomycetota bacterium]|jgi:hypothetical protein
MSDRTTTVASVKSPAATPAAAPEGPGRLYGLLAEFETPAAIMAAAHRVRDAGYRWWDCHTPFPVHGLDKAMGIQRTILPWLVMACGLGGATFGYIVQWFSNATSFDMWLVVWTRGYDFLVSGKPALSNVVYPIVMFELAVLFAAIGCVLSLLLLNKLPRLYHPCLKSERFLRASDDRFFIVIEARDPLFYRTKVEDLLKSLGATAVEPLEA